MRNALSILSVIGNRPGCGWPHPVCRLMFSSSTNTSQEGEIIWADCFRGECVLSLIPLCWVFCFIGIAVSTGFECFARMMMMMPWLLTTGGSKSTLGTPLWLHCLISCRTRVRDLRRGRADMHAWVGCCVCVGGGVRPQQNNHDDANNNDNGNDDSKRLLCFRPQYRKWHNAGKSWHKGLFLTADRRWLQEKNKGAAQTEKQSGIHTGHAMEVLHWVSEWMNEWMNETGWAPWQLKSL